MFITHPLTPAEILAELLTIKGFRKRDTEAFVSRKHDRDLCPRFRDRVSTILDAYKSYVVSVYDTQGPRDDGVDVLLRYENERGEKKRVGLQVKSHSELEAWKKGKSPDFIQKLKAQYASAVENVRVEKYFILLCTDEVQHQRQIRTICSELKQYELAQVVLPRQALAFYEMSEIDVRAAVAYMLCRVDPVLKAASGTLDRDKPIRGLMTIAVTCALFEGKVRWDQKDLAALHDSLQILIHGVDAPEGDLGEAVNSLESDGILRWDEADFVAEVEQLPEALCAIYFDQRVRKAYSGEEMVQYLFALLSGADLKARPVAARRELTSSAR